jgi:hypothetical protein
MPPTKATVKKLKAAMAASAAALNPADGPQVPESVHEQPGGPRKVSLRFGGCIHEEHKKPVYAVSFFEPLPTVDESEYERPASPAPQFFASVGANRATVYKVRFSLLTSIERMP